MTGCSDQCVETWTVRSNWYEPDNYTPAGYSQAMSTTRRLRADGEESRRKILDATAALAGERGFDGTTIAAVSDRSGLPKSSIYWHFEDKDTLITSVVEDSYRRWIDRIKQSTHPADHVRLGEGFGPSIRTITDSPDFLRLGLMLTLDQRSEPLPARDRFLAIRGEVQANLRRLYRNTFPDLDDAGLHLLSHLTMALTDGFFIANEAGEVSFPDHHDLISDVVIGTARRLASAAPTNTHGST